MRNINTHLVFAISLILLVFGSASPATNTGADGNGTLRITVRDPTGAVIAGADVSVRKKDCRCKDCPPEQKPCGCCFQQIRTDDGGQATVSVSGGSYTVKVEVSGFKSADEVEVEIRDGETRSLEVSLKDGSNLVFSGRVLGEDNKRLQNVEILFSKTGCKCDTCSASEKPCKCCISQRAVVDASGDFSVSGLKPTSYDLRIMKDGQTAGTFNGLDLRQSEKVQLTILESKVGRP